MKKILVFAAFIVAGMATALEVTKPVVPKVTQAQVEQSKRIAATQDAMDKKVNEKVLSIMKENGVAPSRKSELKEIVMQKESLLVRLDRENLDSASKKARTEEINKIYANELNSFLKRK
jgi:protein-tyrosine-phosphatase